MSETKPQANSAFGVRHSAFYKIPLPKYYKANRIKIVSFPIAQPTHFSGKVKTKKDARDTV